MKRIMTVEELNECIREGSFADVVNVSESLQRKDLSRIADDICLYGNRRLILIAGGSSSGKTTTANRLRTQLMVNEREVVYLSTDDYFVGDELNPRDENGELDYEHVDCVDVEALTADIDALLSGDVIHERRFDFQHHCPTFTDKVIALPKDGMIILEGIHALNPLLSKTIDEHLKYRVYIEPKPNLEFRGGLMPRPEDARFLRRMVRDCHFRKLSPQMTMKLWPKVLEGDRKWVKPFSFEVDARFNSFLVYEFAVLKNYVGGMLEMIRREMGEVPMITNATRLLAPITPMDASLVPGDSILRETIGGSQLQY